MLKLLLKDPEEFKKQWFDNIKEDNGDRPAFAEGTYVHTLLLEPEKLHEYAVFNGLRKAGKLWEQFKEENPDKKLISQPQFDRGAALRRAYEACPSAVSLLSNGAAEVTATGVVQNLALKSRFDYINVEEGYIVDVKTTSMPSSKDIFKNTVQEYGYDLSAALYAKVAEQVHGKPFDFYWVVLSKSDIDCQVYKVSEKTMKLGYDKLQLAIHRFFEYSKSGVWSKSQPRVEQSNEIEEI